MTMTMDALKVRRHEAILAVIGERSIGSQEDLGRALQRKGYQVTQATLSRDLKELRVSRLATEDGYRYAAAGEGSAAGPEPRRMRSVTAMEVRGLEANEVAVIVRTLTGRAQGVAVYIDGLRMPDVLATLAGDDTILVLPRSVRRTEKVLGALAEVFETESPGVPRDGLARRRSRSRGRKPPMK